MISDQRIRELMGWSADPARVTGVLGGGPDDLPARVRGVAQAAADAARAERGQPVSCEWVQDDEGSDMWIAACGPNRYFTLEDGTPADNRMTYCCWCGGPLREVLA